jgi:hypothetical protein
VEQTEALVSIDVNTGKFVGSRHPEETVLKTNLEAAAEIPRQLRLRDLGGIIVIDFIDMDDPAHRSEVIDALQRALRRDRARTKVVGLSELGLLQLTRKRTRPGIGTALTRACGACGGSGRVKTPETVAWDALREVCRVASSFADATLTVTAHPDVARALRHVVQVAGPVLDRAVVGRLEVNEDDGARFDQFDVSAVSATSEPIAAPHGGRLGTSAFFVACRIERGDFARLLIRPESDHRDQRLRRQAAASAERILRVNGDLDLHGRTESRVQAAGEEEDVTRVDAAPKIDRVDRRGDDLGARVAHRHDRGALVDERQHPPAENGAPRIRVLRQDDLGHLDQGIRDTTRTYGPRTLSERVSDSPPKSARLRRPAASRRCPSSLATSRAWTVATVDAFLAQPWPWALAPAQGAASATLAAGRAAGAVPALASTAAFFPQHGLSQALAVRVAGRGDDLHVDGLHGGGLASPAFASAACSSQAKAGAATMPIAIVATAAQVLNAVFVIPIPPRVRAGVPDAVERCEYTEGFRERPTRS